MRALNEYTYTEWLALKPFTERLKQTRNDVLLAYYRNQSTPELGRFLQRCKSLDSSFLLGVIAFEQPWAIDFLLRSAQRNLTGAQLLVFDNSRNDSMRARIKAVCVKYATPYLGLPRYKTSHANRSHGMALNWAYARAILPLRPAYFGFIDHDLIPVAPVDLRALPLPAAQPIYGLPMLGMPRAALAKPGHSRYWTLWAGYCFYAFTFVERYALNFLYDFSRKLDTGGRNWEAIYSRLDYHTLTQPKSERIYIEIDGDNVKGSKANDNQRIIRDARVLRDNLHVIDRAWWHLGSISYGENLNAGNMFIQGVANYFDNGGALANLFADARATIQPYSGDDYSE